jgi:hypothetical protein
MIDNISKGRIAPVELIARNLRRRQVVARNPRASRQPDTSENGVTLTVAKPLSD